MTTQKDWTQEIIRRFKNGESVAELAEAFQEPTMIIEGIIRRTMQLQGKAKR